MLVIFSFLSMGEEEFSIFIKDLKKDIVIYCIDV